MVLISSGIKNVKAFELSDGVWADGASVGIAKVALVKWKSSYIDKFYHVYVNGRLAGESLDTQQRQMIVAVPTSFQSAVRIEVFAINVSDVGGDYSSEIDFSEGQSGRVKINILRSQKLPAGSQIKIYCDGGSGTIDYSQPINGRPLWVWPVWQDKAGFGGSRFGESDFGFDWAGSVGLGKGVFGHGEFGADADKIEWVSDQLASGVYKFVVTVIDVKGNESTASQVVEVVVRARAKPAEVLEVALFNEQTNELVFNIC